MVQSRQGFDEHIHPFVSVLIPPSREEVQRIVRLEVIVAVEMSSYEVMDLLFRLLMQILELVHSGEFLHVQAIGQYSIRLPLEQMLAFVSRDVGDGGEDVGRVCRGPFDAVSVVYAALSSFCIHIEVLEIVVKVDRPSAKISSEQCSVCGKDGGYIYPSLLCQWESHPS